MNPELLLIALRRSPLGYCLEGMSDAEALSKAAFWFEEVRRLERDVKCPQDFITSGRDDAKDPDTFAVYVVVALPKHIRKVLEINLRDVATKGAIQ